MAEKKTPPTWRDRLDWLAKGLRHPLRLVVVLMAVASVVAPFANGLGIFVAIVTALFGMALGEGVGRVERLRASTLVVVLFGATVIGLTLSRFAVGSALAASMLGPALALNLRSALVIGTLTFTATLGLRLLAVRRPAWRFVELGVVAVAFVASFAAHRGGSIARPLWLSDWAWRSGYDPANVLMAIGAVFGVLCAMLLLMESKHRLSALTVFAVPGLALLLLMVVDPRDLSPEDPADALEDIQDALPTGNGQDIQQIIPITYGHGDPPMPTGPGLLQGPGEVNPGQGDEGNSDGTADAQQGEGEGEGEGDQGQDGPSGDEADGQTDGGAGDEGQGEQGREQGDEGQGDEQGQGDEGQGDQQGQDEGSAGEGDEQGQASDGGQDENGEQSGQDGVADAADGGQEAQGSEGEQGQGDAQGQGQGQGQQSGDAQGEQEGEGSSDEVTASDQASMEFDGGQRNSGGGASVAAVVVFRDDYRTPSGYYYFRQDVHSEYAGSRMELSSRDDADLDVLDHFPETIEKVGDVPPWPMRERVRGRVALLGDHDLPFALESPALYLPASNPNPDRFTRVYQFESYAQEVPYDQLVGRYAGDPEWSEELRDYYLTAPADPRYQELVDEILGDLPQHALDDPFTRALAIKVWLDEHSKYSITRRYPDADDPTAEFLFGDMIGYCVHTAHAAAYLWRLAGVPSRVGTGYLVDESARRGSSLLVMGTDAHAWPELYLDGIGWHPPRHHPGREPGRGPRSGRLGPHERARGDGPGGRDRARGRAGPVPVRHVAPSRCPDPAGEPRRHAAVRPLPREGLAAGAPVHGASRALPRVGYRAVLDRLAEAGLVREEGETREAFARRVADVAPSFAIVTNLHVAAAYADPKRPRADHLDDWRQAMSRLDEELQRTAPWWRRTLGALDPTSFYRAR